VPEAVGVVTRASNFNDGAKPIVRLLIAQLIHQRSCSSNIKSAVAFLNGVPTFKASDSGFQFQDFLLFMRQRLALRSNAVTLLLELINPALNAHSTTKNEWLASI